MIMDSLEAKNKSLKGAISLGIETWLDARREHEERGTNIYFCVPVEQYIQKSIEAWLVDKITILILKDQLENTPCSTKDIASVFGVDVSHVKNI